MTTACISPITRQRCRGYVTGKRNIIKCVSLFLCQNDYGRFESSTSIGNLPNPMFRSGSAHVAQREGKNNYMLVVQPVPLYDHDLRWHCLQVEKAAPCRLPPPATEFSVRQKFLISRGKCYRHIAFPALPLAPSFPQFCGYTAGDIRSSSSSGLLVSIRNLTELTSENSNQIRLRTVG